MLTNGTEPTVFAADTTAVIAGNGNGLVALAQAARQRTVADEQAKAQRAADEQADREAQIIAGRCAAFATTLGDVLGVTGATVATRPTKDGVEVYAEIEGLIFAPSYYRGMLTVGRHCPICGTPLMAASEAIGNLSDLGKALELVDAIRHDCPGAVPPSLDDLDAGRERAANLRAAARAAKQAQRDEQAAEIAASEAAVDDEIAPKLARLLYDRLGIVADVVGGKVTVDNLIFAYDYEDGNLQLKGLCEGCTGAVTPTRVVNLSRNVKGLAHLGAILEDRTPAHCDECKARGAKTPAAEGTAAPAPLGDRLVAILAEVVETTRA